MVNEIGAKAHSCKPYNGIRTDGGVSPGPNPEPVSALSPGSRTSNNIRSGSTRRTKGESSVPKRRLLTKVACYIMPHATAEDLKSCILQLCGIYGSSIKDLPIINFISRLLEKDFSESYLGKGVISFIRMNEMMYHARFGKEVHGTC